MTLDNEPSDCERRRTPEHLAASLTDEEVELLIRVLDDRLDGPGTGSAPHAYGLAGDLSDADVETLLRALDNDS